MLNKIKEDLMNNPKKKTAVLILLFVIVALIFVSTIIPSQGENTGSGTSVGRLEDEQAKQVEQVRQYEKELEDEITGIIHEIDGVGMSKVMVTLESIVSYEYVKESKENTDSVLSGDEVTSKRANYEEKYIFVEGEKGEQQALIKQKLAPKIKGVVIVCEGGDQPVIVAGLVDTVTTIFGIKSTQISVSKLKAVS